MGWLLSNLHIVQTRTHLCIHPFCFLSLDAYLQLLVLSRTPFLTTLQLTYNQQDKKPESTCLQSTVLSLTQSTLLTGSFIKVLDTVTLNNPRTKHTCKGHQRHHHLTACYIHHAEITTPLLNGDTTPHTINRNSP